MAEKMFESVKFHVVPTHTEAIDMEKGEVVIDDPETSEESPVHIQLAVLSILVLVQGGHILALRLSMRGGKAYNTASIIATAEFVKLVVTTMLYSHESGKGHHERINCLLSFKIFGLAVLYCINNQITLWLLDQMDMGRFSFSKGFTPILTAILSWMLFDKYLNAIQWSSIIVICIGMSNVLRTNTEVSGHKSVSHTVIGVMLLSCLMTVLSSLLNERLIKRSQVTMHQQNIRLYSMGLGLNIMAYGLGMGQTGVRGFFDGYDRLDILLVIVMQGLTGIIVSYTYRYADAIVKTIASTSQGVILTVIDATFLHVKMDDVNVSGVILVTVGTMLYFHASGIKSHGLGKEKPYYCKVFRDLKKTVFIVLFLLCAGATYNYHNINNHHHHYQQQQRNLNNQTGNHPEQMMISLNNTQSERLDEGMPIEGSTNNLVVAHSIPHHIEAPVGVAIVVAGWVHPCRRAWHILGTFAKKHNVPIFAVLADTPDARKWESIVNPDATHLVTSVELHTEVKKMIPWITEHPRLLFLPDEMCCHAVELFYRRYVAAGLLKQSGKTFDQIAVIRPDQEISDDWFNKHLFDNVGKRGIWVEQGGHMKVETADDKNCPSGVADWWYTGDSNSIIALLGTMPHLSTLHKEWELEPGFRKWWLNDNVITKADEFFLNTEGLVAKSLRWNNLTCHIEHSGPHLPKIVKAC